MEVLPLATYENCGGCGGTGESFDGREFTGALCRGCGGTGQVKVTITAHKDHTCNLCGKPIPKGEEYVNRRITPWDHPDNEGFATFRTHVACDAVWRKVGAKQEWLFPIDPGEWAEVMAEHGGDTP